MNRGLAEQISLLAAPLYAALLQRHWSVTQANIPPEELSNLRNLAITQAHALWLDTLERPA